MENRMKSIAQRLEEHASPTPSKWRELFDFLETNKSWLRHSQNIAMLMLDRMEELGMSQKQLAEKMNCSPQYISKVLRGRENLSLETLTKIENALEISIIKEEPMAVELTPAAVGKICYQIFPDQLLQLGNSASKCFVLEEAGCRILLAVGRG